jgi:hypothetical protein
LGLNGFFSGDYWHDAGAGDLVPSSVQTSWVSQNLRGLLFTGFFSGGRLTANAAIRLRGQVGERFCRWLGQKKTLKGLKAFRVSVYSASGWGKAPTTDAFGKGWIERR